MQFVKLDASYYLDPAVITLSEAAEIAFVRSIAYAGGAESSGFIPEQALPMLMRRYTPARARALAAELVTALLWEPVPGGWVLRTWEKHQRDLEQLLQRRRSDAERQRRHRSKATPPDGSSREPSRDSNRDQSRDTSRHGSRNAFHAGAPANARESEVELEEELQEPNLLLTDLARRLSRNARETTTTAELAYWEKLAGDADLAVEIEAFLVTNMGQQLDNPTGAWHGWLRTAAQRAAAATPAPRVPDCARCGGTGWDGEDEDHRPRRCACRTVTPITSAPSAGVA